MQPINFDEALDRLLAQDRRYHRDAYLFVRAALDFAQKPISKARKSDICHVTGRELLDAVRRYALEMYGPMAKALLNEWGVFRGEDIGEIVFAMVDARLLSKTETDSREDFKGSYDFYEALCRPFLPSSRSGSPAPAPAATPSVQAGEGRE